MAPKTVLHALAALSLSAAAVAACSGAAEQDVLGPTSSSGGTSSGGTSSGGTSSGGTSSGGASSGGASSGGASSGAPDASPCTSEVEPNDNKEHANALEPSRCGALSPVGDVDFLTFELKPTTKSMRIDFQGKVTLTVTVEGGGTVTLGNGASPPVPFVKGAPYFVEIRPIDKGGNIPWRVDLVEQP